MSDTRGTVFQLERDRATGNDPDSLRREIARLRAAHENISLLLPDKPHKLDGGSERLAWEMVRIARRALSSQT